MLALVGEVGELAELLQLLPADRAKELIAQEPLQFETIALTAYRAGDPDPIVERFSEATFRRHRQQPGPG